MNVFGQVKATFLQPGDRAIRNAGRKRREFPPDASGTGGGRDVSARALKSGVRAGR